MFCIQLADALSDADSVPYCLIYRHDMVLRSLQNNGLC